MKMIQSERISVVTATLMLMGLALLTVLRSRCAVSDYAELLGVIFSSSEVMVGSIYGISGVSSSIIEVIGFAIPFLVLAFLAGLMLTKTLDTGTRFWYIIRYRSYRVWLLNSLFKITLKCLSVWTIYYASVLLFSLILSGAPEPLGEVFHYVNPNAIHSLSFETVILNQYLIGCTVSFVIAASQYMLGIALSNVSKAYICVSLSILMCSALGMANIYNPLMMSRHSFVDDQIAAIAPVITVGLLIMIGLACMLLNLFLLRRKGI